jgi:hypothetical protein
MVYDFMYRHRCEDNVGFHHSLGVKVRYKNVEDVYNNTTHNIYSGKEKMSRD